MRTTVAAAFMMSALLLLSVGPVGAASTPPVACPPPNQPPVFPCFTEDTVVAGLATLPRPQRPPFQHGEIVFVLATSATGRDQNNVAFSRQGGRLRITPAAVLNQGTAISLLCHITDRAPDCSQATLACSDQSFHVVENQNPATGFKGAFDGVPISLGVMDITDPVFCPAPTAE